MICLTHWTQSSFFYFLGPCLLATSRNTGWMDIHEIFRIWTQEAIGYTVSHLSRLLHALQTRRGRGLRSWSASCYACYAIRLIAGFIFCQKHFVAIFLHRFSQATWVFGKRIHAVRSGAKGIETTGCFTPDRWVKNRFAQERCCADTNKHKAVLFQWLHPLVLLEEPQIINLFFTNFMLLHTKQAPLKEGLHITYNADDTTCQKWSFTK